MNVAEKLLFGQFLIDSKKTNRETIDKALYTQKEEKLRETPRMLGSILMNDFKVFQNRKDLEIYLKKFEIYKEKMRKMYLDAENHGLRPIEKLQQEYASLVEELDSAESDNIRNIIEKIELFKQAIRESKKNKKDLESLQQKVQKLLLENSSLRYRIKSLEQDKEQLLEKYKSALKKAGFDI